MKPPLPINPSQFRKGAYHESLDFVLTLCETSFGLVDVFPVEDRKDALHEVISLHFPLMFFFYLMLLTRTYSLLFLSFKSLAEINLHLIDAHNTGGTS